MLSLSTVGHKQIPPGLSAITLGDQIPLRDEMTRLVDPERIVEAFSAYMDHGNHQIARAQLERNIAQKMEHAQFTADIGPLLANGQDWGIGAAADALKTELLTKLAGPAWDGRS